jgi:hypothetical protein
LHRQLNTVAEQMRWGFQMFGRDRDVPHLRDDLDDFAVMIPFWQVDGLKASINHILHRMQHDLSAHVPHAILSARNDVLAVTRADVVARVQAGDVVVR